ncbi:MULTISPECIES: 5-oxoprolinase subunit PxpB [Metabacillus]|uniref:Kinase inhibitor n=2 Tax=Metabacillus TaxID=2675233 RepID=A0A179T698_9BACI|nr:MULTISPECIES: 5-oxoprolinase subunit PxpB [Metabacillus]OAS89321.1 kinase inhibitor [Metabacillus litoralis]QNF28835.1 5-oxoprolinase subunit PxpB [Metabacillus sp. KUDC1714]
MDQITFYPQGDKAITIHFGQELHKDLHQKIIAFTEFIEANPFPGLLEVIPSFTSATISYEPTKIEMVTPKKTPYDVVLSILKSRLTNLPVSISHPSKTVTIPVCYGGDFGPDLQDVADYHHLTQQQIINIHANQEYLVYMIGFAPGFPYLGGMSKEIATPRKATPRLKIPVGSVGIGGEQTGVYPIESPGGWQLIGRTPIRLFRQDAKQPSLLRAGDFVRFQPITPQQFEALRIEKQ